MTAESFPGPIDPSSPVIEKREGHELLQKFLKGQLDEVKTLRRAHGEEIDALNRQQKNELETWKTDSIKRVREYRREHRGQGKMVREFIIGEKSKLDAMRKAHVEAKRKRREEQENQRKSVKAFQEANLEMFKAYLAKGHKPPESLWSSAASQPTPSQPTQTQ